MAVQCPFCGNDTDFMTAGQVARLLGIAPRSVIRKCREGHFPGAVKAPTGLQPDTWRIPVTAVLPLVKGET